MMRWTGTGDGGARVCWGAAGQCAVADAAAWVGCLVLGGGRVQFVGRGQGRQLPASARPSADEAAGGAGHEGSDERMEGASEQGSRGRLWLSA